MQTQNRFFDDLARMAGGTLGLLTGLRTEVESMVRQQLQRLLGDMQLVSREEFEAVKEMAAKARMEQEIAEKRLAALESALASKGAAPRRD
jgi:BMFP domain-containing protein YqiC